MTELDAAAPAPSTTAASPAPLTLPRRHLAHGRHDRPRHPGATAPPPPSTTAFYPQTHAFLWHKDVMTDLGDLGFGSSYENSIAYGINDLGHVVGSSAPPGLASRAFVWVDGVLAPLPSLGGPSTNPGCAANAINNRGLAVGYCTIPSGIHPRRPLGPLGQHHPLPARNRPLTTPVGRCFIALSPLAAAIYSQRCRACRAPGPLFEPPPAHQDQHRAHHAKQPPKRQRKSPPEDRPHGQQRQRQDRASFGTRARPGQPATPSSTHTQRNAASSGTVEGHAHLLEWALPIRRKSHHGRDARPLRRLRIAGGQNTPKPIALTHSRTAAVRSAARASIRILPHSSTAALPWLARSTTAALRQRRQRPHVQPHRPQLLIRHPPKRPPRHLVA